MVTEAFKDGAAAQSRSLGFEPAIVWVAHPIQNRTAKELEKLAVDAIDEVLSRITAC